MTALEDAEKHYAKGATEHRITLDYIKSQIGSAHYMRGFRMVQAAAHSDWSAKDNGIPDSVQNLTICLIVTKSGWTVIGHSTPLSGGNFDETKGREIAYENAVRQLWPLFGFAAKQNAS
jgi:hypothetical protein